MRVILQFLLSNNSISWHGDQTTPPSSLYDNLCFDNTCPYDRMYVCLLVNCFLYPVFVYTYMLRLSCMGWVGIDHREYGSCQCPSSITALSHLFANTFISSKDRCRIADRPELLLIPELPCFPLPSSPRIGRPR